MRRPEFLARQARCPSGLLGRILARIMALETAPENVVTLELLELQPADRVLEIAFGHGATLARAAAAVPDGFTTGVDISRAMVQFAGSRNQPLIESGRMRLKLGDSAALPHPDSCFDKAFAVHVLYFWEDPAPHLLEVRRVLRADGRFVLCFRTDPAAAREFPSSIYHFHGAKDVRCLLERSGFRRVRSVVRKSSGRTITWLIAS